MSQNITAVSPINTLITIQPVSTAATNQDIPGTSPQLANTPNGALIEGFVVNRDAQNNPIVRTPLGDLVVQSDVFIKTGSAVVFRVDNSQPTNARIVTIDQLTPEDYVAQTPHALTQDTIATSQIKLPTAPTAGGQTTAPLPVLPAVVLQALQPTALQQSALFPLAAQQAGLTKAPIPPALMQLTPGTPLNLTIVDIELPPLPVNVTTLPAAPDMESLLPLPEPPASATTTPLPGTTTPSSSAPAPTLSSLPAPLAAGLLAAQEATVNPLSHFAAPSAAATPYAGQYAGNALPATSTQVSGNIPAAATTTPTTTATTTAAAEEGIPLQATVIGHGADGSNILHTPFATVKIYTPQPLPTGTTLTIKAEIAPAQTQIASSLLSSITPPPIEAEGDYAYLTQALGQLQVTDPTVARDLLQQLPVLGPNFTSGLLFFLTAVKGGDIRGLFNPRVASRLEDASPGLLGQLRKDIGELNQNFVNSPLEDWKSIPLPLIYQNEAQIARLYVRKEEENKAAVEKIGGGQRFVLDVNLSQLGPMQLDGFVRSGAQAKSLELYLRSSEPLEPSVSGHIQGLFETALQTTGLGGRLIFQPGLEHFMKPQPAAPTRSGDTGAHTILA